MVTSKIFCTWSLFKIHWIYTLGSSIWETEGLGYGVAMQYAGSESYTRWWRQDSNEIYLSALYSSFRTKEEAVAYPQSLLFFRLASKRLWILEQVLSLVKWCWEYKFSVEVTFHKCQQHPSQSSLWLMSPVYVFWVLVLQKTNSCDYVTWFCMKFFPRGVKLIRKSYVVE
jgi:hypothetical protein